jgi:hypothetical protein
VALGVLVFDIDRSREGPDRVAINSAQLIVETSILFGALCNLLE